MAITDPKIKIAFKAAIGPQWEKASHYLGPISHKVDHKPKHCSQSALALWSLVLGEVNLMMPKFVSWNRDHPYNSSHIWSVSTQSLREDTAQRKNRERNQQA